MADMKKKSCFVLTAAVCAVIFAGCAVSTQNDDSGKDAKKALSKVADKSAAGDKEDNKHGTGKKEKKDKKSEISDYDGTWYEQVPGGGILTVEDGRMIYECDAFTDETGFAAKESDDGYALVPDSDMFCFYEIEYVADGDEIRTHTQPMLDGDGGYKPSIFLRSVYVPGDEATIQYLKGEWEIMDGPEHLQEPGEERDLLNFGDSKYHSAAYTKNGDIARFKYELVDEYGTGAPLYNFLILHNRSGKPQYGWDEVRNTQMFQVFLANDLGHDYMMLRECGSERTGFATEALCYDRTAAGTGTWFFSRNTPWKADDAYLSEDVMPSTVGKEDVLRLKGESFYAIKWTEFGNSCTLQRVLPSPVTIEDYDGEDTDGLCFVMPADRYAYSTVNYEYKGAEMYCHDGYFDPKLVKVTTDMKGQIVEMSEIDYAYDGYWFDTATTVDPVFDADEPVG